MPLTVDSNVFYKQLKMFDVILSTVMIQPANSCHWQHYFLRTNTYKRHQVHDWFDVHRECHWSQAVIQHRPQ